MFNPGKTIFFISLTYAFLIYFKNIDVLKAASVFIAFLAFFINLRINALRSVFYITNEFNKRFDVLNDCLNTENLSVQKIYDYFNLCAEEYFFYNIGLVPESVWNSWFSGMSYYFENKDQIKNLAYKEFKEHEKIKSSYYGFDPYLLFRIS
ncbi:hypothetical protein [Halobacteriovorax sp. DA5]|uniref:hypothetical protein n=1 Tax=Halobacteriovorax sp. DA5 TaxID=2067553 RepID=UPI001E293C77|nr:hypothetical protein [Halobacteriovorax sp. DA5]